MALAWQPLTAIQWRYSLKGLGYIVENPFGHLAECSSLHSPGLRCNKYSFAQGKKIDPLYELMALMAPPCLLFAFATRASLISTQPSGSALPSTKSYTVGKH